ncbi:hypothetical protein PV646_37705 [Streptomyces sp. ID05-26A]|nr:hypothetical protein [Streptomyces sp. ID05-26A]
MRQIVRGVLSHRHECFLSEVLIFGEEIRRAQFLQLLVEYFDVERHRGRVSACSCGIGLVRARHRSEQVYDLFHSFLVVRDGKSASQRQ